MPRTWCRSSSAARKAPTGRDAASNWRAAPRTRRRAAGLTDGFVLEEIAELLDATGKPAQAKPYFKRAADELGKDAWLVENEPGRLARLRERGGS